MLHQVILLSSIFATFDDNHLQNNFLFVSLREWSVFFRTFLISYSKEIIITFFWAEYGTGGKVSSYGDVYSFGIVLLEMFTAKRPTDSMFNDGMTLHNFAKTAVPGRIDEILDPLIRSSEQEEEEGTAPDNSTIGQSKVDQMRECIISIVRIGIACSVESPRERMDIGDAVKELQLIRDILLALEPNCSSTSGYVTFSFNFFLTF